MSQVGLLNRLRAGVFLCGGGARIPRVQQLAEQIFGLPVCLGRAHSISGIRSALDQPEFATAIGLVKFGSLQSRRRPSAGSLTSGLADRFHQLFRSARQ